MHRKAIGLCGGCVVVLALMGCETPADKRQEAREKVAREEDQAVRAQREMAEEVRHEKEQQQRQIGESRKGMAEEVTDEYAEQEKKVGEEQREAQEARAELAEKEADEAVERGRETRLPRFEAIKNETNVAFAQRADARLALLAAEIEVLTEQAKLGASDKREAMDKELTKAREAFAEAQKDLEEVRERTGTFIDDGRLGVAMAINRAERKLENVREDLRGTIY
jgi:colicin import membrane protein